MLKRVAYSLGLVEKNDKDPRRKSQLRGTKASPDYSFQKSNDIFVRIVHGGGKQELYQDAILASKLMEKYPGMCVARPEVFKNPHQSVLWPEERLLPGKKYIIISFRDVGKLKRKLSEEGKIREPNGVAPELLKVNITKSPKGHSRENGKSEVHNEVGQEEFEAKTSLSPGGRKTEENRKIKIVLDANAKQSLDDGSENEPVCSSEGLHGSWDKRYPRRKGIKGKKPFVPPLPRVRPYRISGWQPSLPSVPELSP
ncbi:uncharacterized protein LOC114714015 [Neltuma alba]|uniref:uncharacterized protein LOC114714015 n=1 Tax=Neltuma alba TaxID=207710 RepID=UPI0010A2DDB8|nr:uncharacterized protein LOC114714015 [Prosopis alba]